jgi:alpha-tubulin suppressor-like RCC1 family protein
VWAWGDNNTGQLGDGAACGKYCTTPVQAKGLTGAGWIAGGYVHSLAENTGGSVYGWGSNSYGQLGNGTTTVAITPTLVTGVTAVH